MILPYVGLYCFVFVVLLLVLLAIRNDVQYGRYSGNTKVIAWCILLTPVWPLGIVYLIGTFAHKIYQETK